MAKYGYARISTVGKGQKLDRQLYELLSKIEGLEEKNIFTDMISGRKLSRDGLNQLMEVLKSGDEVYVESLSRLSRSTPDLLSILQNFSDRNIEFHSLKENFDFSTLYGKLILTFLSALVQFERDLIAQRVKEGLNVARLTKHIGRPCVEEKKIQQALEMYNNPARTSSVASIAEMVGISKSSLYRAVNKQKMMEVSENG